MKKNSYFVALVAAFTFVILGCASTGMVRADIVASNATATVVGRPSLVLTYDRLHRESLLTATFNVAVTGGTTGVNIYKNNGAWANFIDQKGAHYSLHSQKISINGNVSMATDTVGQPLLVIPANQSVVLKVVGTVNPQELFAGAYTASLEAALTAVVGTDASAGFKIPLTVVPSNTVTILGEVSPYISSISYPVVLGSSVTIYGQRLNGWSQYSYGSTNPGKSRVFIDGVVLTSPVSFSRDGKMATFTLPTSLQSGSHVVSVTNSITGLSNSIGFQINSGTTNQNFVNLIVDSPVSGVNQSVGIRASIKGDVSNKKVSKWVLSISCSTGVTLLDPRSADLCNTQQTYYASNYYDVTQDIVLLTIDAKNNGVSSNPNVSFVLTAYDSSNGAIGSDKEIVSLGSTTPIGGQPTITFNTTGGSPSSLVLGYDTMNKESLLTGTFNFSVNGGSQGVNIVQNSGGAVFTDQSGNRPSLNSIRNTLRAINSGAITTTDNYGQVLYKVPAGKNVDFQLVTTAIPREMFAGSYSASLIAVSANPGSIITNQYNLSAPSNKTNSVTIVGELSPYISSITSPVSAGQTVMVKGQRLNGMTFAIDGQLIQNSLVSISIDGTSLSFVLPSFVATGQHYFTVNNDTTGLSNRAGFQVGTGVTPPTSYDSDGGKNYFVKGTTTGITKCVYQDQCTTPTTSVDVCWKDNHEGAAGNENQLHEYYIGADGYKYVEFYQSPTGCENGAAKQYVVDEPMHTPDANDQQVIFTKNFMVSQQSGPTILSIETDNEYSISINGLFVGASNKQANFFQPTTYDITQYVQSGGNNKISITVTNQNSPVGFVWSDNPAGLAYTIKSGSNLITSSDGTEQSSYMGSNNRSIVIPTTSLCPMWVNLPGANWIWNESLFKKYGNTTIVPNQSPVISGGAFPTTLSIGQTGTWTVNAYDPQNGTLNYSVNWGDTPVSSCAVGQSCATQATAISQTSTFTHSYASAGTYNVKFTVQNSAGSSGTITSTVQVGSVTTTANPYIGSINPSAAPIGTTLQIRGSNLNGFEGDVIFTFERSDGKKINLRGTSLLQSTGDVTGGQTTSVVLKEPCQPGQTVYGDYSGIPSLCNYAALTPGVYKVYTNPYGAMSNVVNFTVTSKVAPIVSEQVRCVFNNSNNQEKCYSSDGKYGFSGVGTAVGTVSGSKGDQIAWNSSCIAGKSSPMTTLDGQDESINFTCVGTTQPSVVASNVSATLGTAVVQNNTTVAYNFNMSVTLTNTGSSNVYISNRGGGTDITALLNPSIANVNYSRDASPIALAGDLSGTSLVIPAGASRTFTFNGALLGQGQAGMVSYAVTSFVYGTTASNPTGFSLTTGLENMKIVASFNGTATTPGQYPILRLASVSWNNFGDTTPDKYLNPRVNFGKADSLPFNDSVTATEWCKNVPDKKYVSGISQINWANPQDGNHYKFDGSNWTMIGTGDYPRAYICSVAPTTTSTKVTSSVMNAFSRLFGF